MTKTLKSRTVDKKKLLKLILAYDDAFNILFAQLIEQKTIKKIKITNDDILIKIEKIGQLDLKTSEFLKENYEKDNPDIDDIISNYDDSKKYLIYPIVVNLAFMIELTLKLIITFNGDSVSGHDISKLFKKLDLAQRTSVITSMKLTENDFDLKIESNKNHFPHWRYFFEDNEDRRKPDFIFLRKLYLKLSQELTHILQSVESLN